MRGTDCKRASREILGKVEETIVEKGMLCSGEEERREFGKEERGKLGREERLEGIGYLRG